MTATTHDRSRGRQRLAEAQAEAARADRRRRTVVRGAVVTTVLLLVVGVVVIANLGRAAEQARSAPPTGLVDGGMLVGDADVTVTVYADYLCPACGSFDDGNRQQLAEWVGNGTVQVDYRPIAILDHASPDGYPTRALAAAAAVFELAPRAFVAYNDALYGNQPVEGRPGLSDEELAELAVDVGAPDTVRELIDEGRFVEWAAATTDAASRSGVVGTPTVLVDGTVLEDRSPAGLAAAVAAAG